MRRSQALRTSLSTRESLIVNRESKNQQRKTNNKAARWANNIGSLVFGSMRTLAFRSDDSNNGAQAFPVYPQDLIANPRSANQMLHWN